MTAEDSQSNDNELLPGALLKAAREKAGLSEEEVARELHITVKKVRALEADDYQQLHSDIFIRGYLRGYAKLVDLEPEALLESYTLARRQAGLDAEEEESPLQINIPEPRRPLWHFGLGIGLLLLVLWAGSVWFLDNRPPRNNQGPEVEAGLSRPDTQPPSQQEAADQKTLDESEPSLEEASTTGAEASSEQTQAEPQSPQASQVPAEDSPALGSSRGAEPEDGLDRLRLSFSDECWVEVVDARGDVLETDLLLAGESLELRGEAPFEVKLGNAQAVQVELNGEPFAFEPPQAGRTLTLEVAGSET